MNENIYDRVTQKIEQKMIRAMGKIDKQFKNVPAYDTPKIPEREKLFMYEQLNPIVKQAYMQQDPAGYQNLEMEIDKLRRKYARDNYESSRSGLT